MVCTCNLSWEGLVVVTGVRPGSAPLWEEPRCTHDSLNQNTAQEVLGTKTTGESAHRREGQCSSHPSTRRVFPVGGGRREAGEAPHPREEAVGRVIRTLSQVPTTAHPSARLCCAAQTSFSPEGACHGLNSNVPHRLKCLNT